MTLLTRADIISRMPPAEAQRLTAKKEKPEPKVSEIEAITAQEVAIESEGKARIAELRKERERLCAIQHPLNVLLQERAQRLEAIAIAERHKVDIGFWDTQRRALLAPAFANPGPITLNIANYVAANALVFCAAQITADIDHWIADRKAELPEVENRIREYAKANNLAGL